MLLIKKKLSFILLFIVFFTGCNTNKKSYEDYAEDDFYSVQGIVTRVHSRYNYVDKFSKRDLYYIYYLELDKPLKGYEAKTPYMIENGEPVEILVHKKDSSITFFGSRGIFKEQVLLNYLDKCDEEGYYGLDDERWLPPLRNREN